MTQKGTGGVGHFDPERYPHQELTERIIGAAIEAHRELGSGFLEKVYEQALSLELKQRGIPFTTQPALPVKYKGQLIGSYYADLVVDGTVLCEIKALGSLNSVHESQVIHYLKATGIKVGLLLNFGSRRVQIKRVVL